MKKLVIVPTYNEAENIEVVLKALLELEEDLDVLVIDDNSPDETGRLVKALSLHEPRVKLIERPKKLGLGSAYKLGFSHGLEHGYDVLVEFDADGSHQAAELPELLRAIENGADLALGSRWVSGGQIIGWPWFRQWISKTGTRVAQICLGSRLVDLTSGFRAIRSEEIKKIDMTGVTSNGYGFQVETAWLIESSGAKITEVPITFIERAHGKSKMSIAIVFEALVMVLRLGSRRIFFHNTQKSSFGKR